MDIINRFGIDWKKLQAKDNELYLVADENSYNTSNVWFMLVQDKNNITQYFAFHNTSASKNQIATHIRTSVYSSRQKLYEIENIELNENVTRKEYDTIFSDKILYAIPDKYIDTVEKIDSGLKKYILEFQKRNDTLLNNLILKYAKYKNSNDYNEQYKYDYAQKYKGIFDDLSNLKDKINTLEKPNFTSYFLGKCSGLKHLVLNHIDSLKDALAALFSDNDLKDRIVTFENILNEKLKNDSTWRNKNTLVDVQTASYFLFTNDYEKYLLFTKMSPYNKFAEVLNLLNLKKYDSEEDRYINWQNCCFNELLPAMDSLLNKKHSLLDVQDFIWFVGNNNNETINDDKQTKITTASLNQILYGPPGTGKTYCTQEYIKEILKDNLDLNIENENQKINDAVKDLTWHCAIALSMYQNGKNEKYKVSDLLEHKIIKAFSQTKESNNEYSTIISRLQMHTIPESNTVNYTRRLKPYIFDKTENSKWYLTKNGIDFVEENLAEQLEKLNTKNSQRKPEDFYKFITFHQSYSYEEFVEGIRPKINTEEESNIVSYEYNKGVFKEICQQANSDPQNKYLLIIDEINRGNISKIFGELITLIEADKRVTPNGERIFENTKLQDGQFLAVLPYTKSKFAIPDNLYILGTMNTSDRSIASIDIALRRRFKFIEMMPDKNLVADFGIGFCEIFENLNTKIKVLLDRDHQIGHSYFIKTKYANSDINTLKEIYFSEILPLLNEYFYCDWEKLRLIVPGFIKKIEIPPSLQNECEEEIYEFKIPSDFKTNEDFINAIKL